METTVTSRLDKLKSIREMLTDSKLITAINKKIDALENNKDVLK